MFFIPRKTTRLSHGAARSVLAPGELSPILTFDSMNADGWRPHTTAPVSQVGPFGRETYFGANSAALNSRVIRGTNAGYTVIATVRLDSWPPLLTGVFGSRTETNAQFSIYFNGGGFLLFVVGSNIVSPAVSNNEFGPGKLVRIAVSFDRSRQSAAVNGVVDSLANPGGTTVPDLDTLAVGALLTSDKVPQSSLLGSVVSLGLFRGTLPPSRLRQITAGAAAFDEIFGSNSSPLYIALPPAPPPFFYVPRKATRLSRPMTRGVQTASSSFGRVPVVVFDSMRRDGWRPNSASLGLPSVGPFGRETYFGSNAAALLDRAFGNWSEGMTVVAALRMTSAPGTNQYIFSAVFDNSSSDFVRFYFASSLLYLSTRSSGNSKTYFAITPPEPFAPNKLVLVAFSIGPEKTNLAFNGEVSESLSLAGQPSLKQAAVGDFLGSTNFFVGAPLLGSVVSLAVFRGATPASSLSAITRSPSAMFDAIFGSNSSPIYIPPPSPPFFYVPRKATRLSRPMTRGVTTSSSSFGRTPAFVFDAMGRDGWSPYTSSLGQPSAGPFGRETFFGANAAALRNGTFGGGEKGLTVVAAVRMPNALGTNCVFSSYSAAADLVRIYFVGADLYCQSTASGFNSSITAAVPASAVGANRLTLIAWSLSSGQAGVAINGGLTTSASGTPTPLSTEACIGDLLFTLGTPAGFFLNGFVVAAAVFERSTPNPELVRLSSSPSAMFDAIFGSNSSPLYIPGVLAGTITRPNSDVVVTGWTGVPDNASLYANIDETSASDDDYISSPDLSAPSPATFGLTQSLAVGVWDVRVRARRTQAAGELRVLLLDGSNAVVGTSAWQALGASFADYTLPVTTTGEATRVRIEVR